MSRYEQFVAFRARLNERILREQTTPAQTTPPATPPTPGAPAAPARGGTLNTRRFFQLDTACYKPGALDAKTKELLGLAASMVLRCDDCIAYHVDRCLDEGLSDDELWECFDIALLVGGSIVIPHLRRAVDFLDQARAARPAQPARP